jgi:hypothetical protein
LAGCFFDIVSVPPNETVKSINWGLWEAVAILIDLAFASTSRADGEWIPVPATSQRKKGAGAKTEETGERRLISVVRVGLWAAER